MKPYKPIDLEKFDEEFFSVGKENQNHDPQEKKIFTDPDETCEKSPCTIHPSLTPDVVEGLMNIKASSENPVFHTFPDELSSECEKPKEETAPGKETVAPSKRKPKISEEEALKSFPDFEFDASLFECDGNEVQQSQPSEKELIKEHKAKAKQEIKDEREKINAQIRLEHFIQKPFKAKRVLVFFFVIFLLFGILTSAAGAALYMTGSTAETTFDFMNHSLCYIDGENILSSENSGTLVLLSHESVTSSKMILYRDKNMTRYESIVAIGEGFCAVNFDKRIHTVSLSDVEGFAVFSISTAKPIYDFIHTKTAAVAVIIIIYFAAVISVFATLIALKNKKIKTYRENFQLVS